jgi:carboxylesterase
MKRFLFLFLFFTSFLSCHKEGKMPPIDNLVDLDGTVVNDSSITFPERFLLSARILTPTLLDLNKPVVICVHGFSASTFEWIEFRDFATSLGTFNTSIVLLGGHGTNYEDFKKASWEDWQNPIIEEYNKLVNLGYTNINIAGSSTGAPLILNMIYENKVNTSNLKNLFLIDPIIVPSNKTLSLVKVVGPLLSYTETTFTPGEVRFWYRFRPYQALNELNQLTKKVRKKIEKGITLPQGVKLQVYKSEKDDAADPISAVIIEKGITLNDQSPISVQMISSNLHVFTRLSGRTGVIGDDVKNQENTFQSMLQKIN